jgi:hypothetical protein
VKDPGLDLHTSERIARGGSGGSPQLAKLLAVARAEPTVEELGGEEAAVAAFRQARALPRRTRRLWVFVSLKAAVIGLLLLLTGGLTVVAVSQHLPIPLKPAHPHRPRTPTTSETTRASSAVPSRSAPTGQPTHQVRPPRGDRSTDPSRSASPDITTGPQPTTSLPDPPGSTKKIKGKLPTIPTVKIPTPDSVTTPAVPSASGPEGDELGSAGVR